MEWMVYPPALMALMFKDLYMGIGLSNVARRLGMGMGPLPWEDHHKSPRIWVHALSFGEVRAALPLLSAIKKRWPNGVLMASSSTASGLAELENRAGGALDQLVPMPYDFTPCLLRTIRSLSPQCFVLIETDVWPNLLWRLKERGTRIVFANGAISSRAKRRLSRVRRVARFLYGPFDHICMQSGRDVKRLMGLGIEAWRISDCGSLKFDALPMAPEKEVVRETGREFGLGGDHRINCVFGSLHKGEERCLLDCVAHFQAQGCLDRVRFVVAPRYPEISNDLKKRLSGAGLKVVLRSEFSRLQDSPASRDFNCLIVDTLGELIRFYAVAHVAVLGGTFVPVGGHNVLEPVSLGLPTIVGPYVESIEDVCRELQERDALIRVDSWKGFPEALSTLMKSPDLRRAIGERARAYVDARRGVKERYVALIEELLDETR